MEMRFYIDLQSKFRTMDAPGKLQHLLSVLLGYIQIIDHYSIQNKNLSDMNFLQQFCKLFYAKWHFEVKQAQMLRVDLQFYDIKHNLHILIFNFLIR